MRRQLLFVAVALAVLPGVARAEDRRTDKSRLVVMTSNALFMWDGVAPEEGNVQFPWRGSQTEAEDHMKDIAQVIIRSNPDVVNLVEIEGENALKTLNDKFLQGRGYKPYFVEGKDTATGQDVGLLTRIDPEGDKVERDDRTGQSGNVTKGVSKNYFARFSVNGKKIALVSAHFLAQPNSENRRKPREAQAAVIARKAVELADEGFAPIVLGDFNDYDGDVPDHVGNQPISKVLRILKGMKPDDDNDDLVNVVTFVPKARRYTAFWDKNENDIVEHPGEHSSIDHILIAPALKAAVEEADIPHEHDPLKVSDHYPIVLRLKLGGGDGAGGPKVVIARLLPNPPGDENQNEEATIKNGGTAAVDLTGYRLRDLAGKTWKLDALGMLAAGQEKLIKRGGQAMAMNNTGDTIELLDPDGNVIDSVRYGRVVEDEVVTRNP